MFRFFLICYKNYVLHEGSMCQSFLVWILILIRHSVNYIFLSVILAIFVFYKFQSIDLADSISSFYFSYIYS